MSSEAKPNIVADTSDRVAGDEYDPHIVPAETGAREEREGNAFKTRPTEQGTSPDSIHTTDGYTVDKEGLLNNYAVEPEMYINEPGDLRERDAQLAAERVEELKDIQADKQGDLTLEDDKRGHGEGMI